MLFSIPLQKSRVDRLRAGLPLANAEALARLKKTFVIGLGNDVQRLLKRPARRTRVGQPLTAQVRQNCIHTRSARQENLRLKVNLFIQMQLKRYGRNQLVLLGLDLHIRQLQAHKVVIHPLNEVR